MAPPALHRVCFVLSPIGREGTEEHRIFREAHDFVIKPAVLAANPRLKVIRLDDIDRGGSFIAGVFDYLAGAHVVIADLTGRQPNVLYGLGIRHALSPRTVLIAQSVEDIPVELMGYRVIIYEASARGAEEFAGRLKATLAEIESRPNAPDNPVLDRIGGYLTERTAELEQEIRGLTAQLDAALRQGPPDKKRGEGKLGSTDQRLSRILTLRNADRRFSFSASLQRQEGDKLVDYSIPSEQGNFDLYFLLQRGKIGDIWYVSAPPGAVHLKNELADIRVLTQRLSVGSGVGCTFIIASQEDLSSQVEGAQADFAAMKKYLKPRYRKLFQLEIWDREGMRQKETELGIRIPKEKASIPTEE